LKVLFDSNVFVAAFLTEGLCWKILMRANRKEFRLFISPYIRQEVQDTLAKKLKFPAARVRETLSLIDEIVMSVDPEQQGIQVREVCRDPKDHPILASTLVAKANYLVTGDADLLTLRQYKGINIITPRMFETLFGSAGPD
jgi:putative PIN family toxin of toxin-antitoxin system